MTNTSRRAVNIAELLTQTARRLPEAYAVISGDTRWTWRNLDRKVDALAQRLRQRGIGRGDCVLLHSPNHVEFVQVMFATWRVGAVLAPTNFRLTPADITGIAGVCHPSLMVCHRDYADHVEAVRTVHGLPGGVLWIADDGPDAVASAGQVDGSLKPANEPVSVADTCWYFFTSGTSGTPKAALLTHDQMGFVVTNHLSDLMPGITDAHVSLVVAPLSHGAGIHLLPQVARGAASVLTASARLDGEEVWRLVESEAVTNMFTVPTILKRLVEHPAVHRHDHGSLRHVIYAGAPMYAVDQDRARGKLGEVLVQYYGLGEVPGNITVLPSVAHTRQRPQGMEFGSCGYPRTGMQVSIQDGGGRELPLGGQGEICVAGPAVFAGYLNNPTANDAAFREGWFRTGDTGLLDQEGYLYVTGRMSDMYISGGSNVHPRDIEEKLLQHPQIAEVAVLGMPDPDWGEVGVAVCVAGGDVAPDPEELRAWLQPRIARYKMPQYFLLWQELPKSGYGKIAKRAIRTELQTLGWSQPHEAGALP
ncbi:MAG: acyl-CoA synthetase [Sciscionella sp.]